MPGSVIARPSARRRRPVRYAAPLRPAERPRRLRVGLYFGVLSITSGLGDPAGLISVPLLFLLKDHFQLSAPGVALFEAIIFLPVYLGFLFGFLRDRLRLGGWGDRGYILLMAPLAALTYLWLGSARAGYAALLAGVLLIMVAYQFIDTAAQALMTGLGRRYRMTGALSALSETGDTVTGVAAAVAGGWLVARGSYSAAFLIAGLLTLAVFAQAFWKPRAVFPKQYAPVVRETGLAAVQRLRRHRGIWPAVAILVLWNFSPGWGTPLFYFLTDDVALSSTAFGLCRGIHLGAAAAAVPVYAVLAQRLPLRPVLRWIVLLNIFPGLLFLVIDGPAQAYAVSALIGVLTSLANIALLDLLMRSCPPKLEGVGTMTGLSAFALAGTVGDLAGAWLYEAGGFATCLVLEALATALILPTLRRVPARLVARPDA